MELTAVFQVAGVAVATHFSGVVLEHLGQSDKVVYLKIAGYMAAAYIGFTAWWDGVRYVASTFGVML